MSIRETEQPVQKPRIFEIFPEKTLIDRNPGWKIQKRGLRRKTKVSRVDVDI